MTKVIDNTNLGYLISKIKAAFWGKNETTQVSIDNTPTANSNNLVKSGGVHSSIQDVQNSVGTLSNLTTTTKTSTVAAINELVSDIGSIETILSSL